jgi:hypothetical protein
MTIPVKARVHSPRLDSTYLSGITVQMNRAISLRYRFQPTGKVTFLFEADKKC